MDHRTKKSKGITTAVKRGILLMAMSLSTNALAQESEQPLPPFLSIYEGFQVKDQSFINSVFEKYDFEKTTMQSLVDQVRARALSFSQVCPDKLGAVEKYLDDLMVKKIYDSAIEVEIKRTNGMRSAKTMATLLLNKLSVEKQKELMVLPKTEFTTMLVNSWLTNWVMSSNDSVFTSVASAFINKKCK